MDNLFTSTSRPDRGLFFSRGDPNDQRLGDRVSSDPAAYAAAQVVILGCPQDEGVRRNGGRPGAAEGPAALRSALYRLGVSGLDDLMLFDLGDTLPGPDLEATHTRQRAIVRQVLAAGKLLISIGGGNDISYPDCAGLVAVSGRVLAFNVDAHYDVRTDRPRNSGTPYRQLLDEGLIDPAYFVELGSQPFANSPVYTRYLLEQGVRIYGLPKLRARGLEHLLGELLESDAAAIFWGLDMDVVRAADAPGVSAPNPLGMSGEELCRIAAIAGADQRSQLLEISELNPRYDLDGRTARLAAATIWHFLAARYAG